MSHLPTIRTRDGHDLDTVHENTTNTRKKKKDYSIERANHD